MSTKIGCKASRSLVLRGSGLLEKYRLEDALLVAAKAPYYALFDRDARIYHILVADALAARYEWLGAFPADGETTPRSEIDALLEDLARSGVEPKAKGF